MEKKEEKERGFVCTRRTELMKYARDRFIEGKFGWYVGRVERSALIRRATSNLWRGAVARETVPFESWMPAPGAGPFFAKPFSF